MLAARARAHARTYARTHVEYAATGYGLYVSTIKPGDATVIKK